MFESCRAHQITRWNSNTCRGLRPSSFLGLMGGMPESMPTLSFSRPRLCVERVLLLGMDVTLGGSDLSLWPTRYWIVKISMWGADLLGLARWLQMSGRLELGLEHEARWFRSFEENEILVLPQRGPRDEIQLIPQRVKLAPLALVEDQVAERFVVAEVTLHEVEAGRERAALPVAPP